MSKLSERLDSTTYKTTRLEFCLDGELRNERDRVLAEVAAARDAAKQHNQAVKDGATSAGRLAAPSEIEARLERALAAADELDGRIADSLIVIEVSALPGTEWSRIKYKHPVGERPSTVDRNIGANSEAVTIEALLSRGAFIDGDEREPLSVHDIEKLRGTITDGDWDRIKVALLDLNQVDGFRGVGHLKARSSETPSSDSN